MLTADSPNWMVGLWALRLLPPGKAAGLCRFVRCSAARAASA